MSKKLLIDARQSEETRVVVLNNNQLEDFDHETSHHKPIKGNIYLARVTRVEPSLQAAFVEYGGNRQGFLAFNEIHPDYYRIPIEDRKKLLAEHHAQHSDDDDPAADAAEDAIDDDADDIRAAHQHINFVRHYKIQEVISNRQIILVQVVKEERGSKGAALTTYISLAGRFCVFMPNTHHGGGVSRKINSAADRKKLKKIVESLTIPDGMAVIVRTAGAERTKAEITRDFTYLKRQWDDIRGLTMESAAPVLIHEEGNLIKRAIRDYYTADIDTIVVDGAEAYKTARTHMKNLMPSHIKKIKEHDDRVLPLLQKYQVEDMLASMIEPQIRLKSGGYLVINHTEALVAIDINSGKSTRERNIEETATNTNLEAAEEIAHQLRLRDLSGLIVIDFIDMEIGRNRQAVERKLIDAVKADRARIQIGSISQFGLLEMSRQRLRPSFAETVTSVCPHCQGGGRVYSAESAALFVLRAIETQSAKEETKTNGGAIHASTHSSIAFAILNSKRTVLTEMEQRLGVRITITANDNIIAPQVVFDTLQGQDNTTKKPRGRGVKSRVEARIPPPENEPALSDTANSQPPNSQTRDDDTFRRRRRRGYRRSRYGRSYIDRRPQNVSPQNVSENGDNANFYDASNTAVQAEASIEMPAPVAEPETPAAATTTATKITKSTAKKSAPSSKASSKASSKTKTATKAGQVKEKQAKTASALETLAESALAESSEQTAITPQKKAAKKAGAKKAGAKKATGFLRTKRGKAATKTKTAAKNLKNGTGDSGLVAVVDVDSIAAGPRKKGWWSS